MLLCLNRFVSTLMARDADIAAPLCNNEQPYLCTPLYRGDEHVLDPRSDLKVFLRISLQSLLSASSVATIHFFGRLQLCSRHDFYTILQESVLETPFRQPEGTERSLLE